MIYKQEFLLAENYPMVLLWLNLFTQNPNLAYLSKNRKQDWFVFEKR